MNNEHEAKYAQQRADFRRQVAEIVAHIPGYRLDGIDNLDYEPRYAKVISEVNPARRFTIWAGQRYGAKGRFEVSAEWPQSADNKAIGLRGWAYGLDEPRIYVSPERKPETVARDICRRFIAEFEPLHAMCESKRAQAVDYRDKVLSDRERLVASVSGGSIDERDDHGFRWSNGGTSGHVPGYGTGQVYGDSVSLDIRGLPLDAALKILASL